MTRRQRRAQGFNVVAPSTTGRNGSSDVGTLVYDGDCGFCTTSAGWARRLVPGLVTVAWQLTDLNALGVPESDAAEKVQYVDSRGSVSGGAEAIARLFVDRGGLVGAIGRVMLLPGIRLLAAGAYHLVAANRQHLPGGTPACKLAAGDKDG